MIGVKSHPILWLIVSIFILAGCSKKPEEALLEKYYRAAAEQDAKALQNMTDFSMFDKRSAMSRGLAQGKAQALYSDINELYDKHGELQKVIIKKSEEIQENGMHVFLVDAELHFKNERKIIRKEALSKHGSEWKILMINEWAGM